jgi:Tol biopolymer transport system component
MDMRGLNCKKASPVPGVKDFDWSPDSRYIACIRSTGGRPDEICVIDMDNFDETVLSGCDRVIHKRKIAFSPDGRSIAFIGSNFGTEDVFVLNMEHGLLMNITNNYSNILVSDFVWKVDGTKIYYASNELYYYNIYSLSLKDRARHQLTNCEASDIKLCYRPRIR